MSVSDAVSGGREAVLKALLIANAAKYDECESLRDAKALSLEIRDTVRELAEFEVADESGKPLTGIDELRLRREARAKERKSG